MARNIALQELLVGVEGLALLRHLYDGTDAQARQRLAEVARVLADDSLAGTETTAEAPARAGYPAWSETYDEPGNPIVAIEEPAVWAILDGLPPGRALDAACGTGRHGRRLAAAGHEVIGLDLTPEMLARAGMPAAEADLLALPVSSTSCDLAVCALALAHVADLDPAVAELARVLRPRGRLVVLVLHPFQAHLGWHAPVRRRRRTSRVRARARPLPRRLHALLPPGRAGHPRLRRTRARRRAGPGQTAGLPVRARHHPRRLRGPARGPGLGSRASVTSPRPILDQERGRVPGGPADRRRYPRLRHE